MSIISMIAETFSYTILTICTVLHKFLQLNFTIVASIIDNINILTGSVSEKIILVSEVFKYCYQDFVIFLYEVISVTSFTIDIITNFLSKTYSKIRYIVSIFSDFIYLVYLSAISLSNLICFCALQLFTNSVYLIQLIFTSLLLILEAGPNLLIFMYETFLHCLFCSSSGFKHYAASLTQDVYHIYSQTSEAVFSIPVKAYFGALLFIMIFYQYRLIINYFKAYIRMLLLFLLYIGEQIKYFICICLEPIMYFLVMSFKKIQNIFSVENEQESDIFYEASSSHFNTCAHSHPKRRRKFHKYIQGVKSLFPACPFVSRHQIEEQIEQLKKELSAEREKHLCIICCDRPRNIILYPCKHMCICEECCVALQMELQGCPLCRSSIMNVFHVYI